MLDRSDFHPEASIPMQPRTEAAGKGQESCTCRNWVPDLPCAEPSGARRIVLRPNRTVYERIDGGLHIGTLEP